jgi:hypothetical protein
MKKRYKIKQKNITKLRSYLENKSKNRKNERNSRHSSSCTR